VLTTYRYRSHPSRRLRVTDLRAFRRAFGSDRFVASGRLSREALERRAAELIGDWFPAACADPARRGAAGGSRFRPSPSMPWHVDKAYRVVREEAQHAFWAQRDDAALSMLHQLAKQIAT
jgi:hypothetical protein